jgi:hypothetical protein
MKWCAPGVASGAGFAFDVLTFFAADLLSLVEGRVSSGVALPPPKFFGVFLVSTFSPLTRDESAFCVWDFAVQGPRSGMSVVAGKAYMYLK